jgi:hypothetical protein
LVNLRNPHGSGTIGDVSSPSADFYKGPAVFVGRDGSEYFADVDLRVGPDGDRKQWLGTADVSEDIPLVTMADVVWIRLPDGGEGPASINMFSADLYKIDVYGSGSPPWWESAS